MRWMIAVVTAAMFAIGCATTPGDPGPAPTPQPLATGEAHSCEVRTGSQLWCWGTNGDGQLGGGTNVGHLIPVFVPTLTTPKISRKKFRESY
jgi:hypothetical protein